jgi:TldD protein
MDRSHIPPYVDVPLLHSPMTNRRDFLKTGAAAGALAIAGPALTRADALAQRVAPYADLPAMDAATKELLIEALNAAKLGGASFADARIGRYRNNFVITREKQIVNVVDTDTLGVGVRVLVNGTWGFGASRDLTKSGVVAATKEAVAIAKANALPAADRVRLAPATPTPDGRYVTPHTIDPFTVPIEEKADLLIRANTEAMKVDGVKFVNSNMFFVKEEKNYANTEGTFTTQTVLRSWLPFAATAVKPDFSDFQTRTNVIQPAARGYEYLTDAKPIENARKWGEEAAEKLKAKAVDVGRYDLVLHPTHLWLTIHESIAHPTELDRALGYEANYAGTSFLAPPREKLGKFRYGPSFMNIEGDRDQAGGCSTIGWDDDGVKPERFLIIKNGVVNDYQNARAGPDAGLVVRQPEASGAQPWLLPLRQLERRAVPAHAERLAAAGREGAGLRGHHRRHGQGHCHRGRRKFLHRPAALQRAVRRAALL